MEAKDLETLKSLAEAATPGTISGSWNSVVRKDNTGKVLLYAVINENWENVVITYDEQNARFGKDITGSLARFIAAANPATVLNLIAEVERLNALVDLWKRDYETFVDECMQLDREAEWLAEKCYLLCASIEMCCDESCNLYDVCNGDYAPYNRTGWREAAKKEIEKLC